MERYKLIALDIVEGLDDNFYVLDINGLIGVNSIIQHKKEFDEEILNIFGEEVNIECGEFIKDRHKIEVKTDSNIIIQNNGFANENKLLWRKEYNLPCPKINNEIIPHKNPNYPKYLLKPDFSFQGRGITLLNKKIEIPENHFLEEFIPGKTIDGHCNGIRVIMIISKKECKPLLYLNRVCCNPILENIKEDILDEEQSLSYINNRCKPLVYFQNKDSKLKEFIKTIQIYAGY